jgi:hypothetical protein
MHQTQPVTEKAKARRNGAASRPWWKDSIKKSGRQDRDQKTDTRWIFLIHHSEKKMELETARIEAAKMEAHVTLIKAIDEVCQLKVTKMAEDSKFFTANMSNMDADVKAWFLTTHKHIIDEIRFSNASVPSAALTPA